MPDMSYRPPKHTHLALSSFIEQNQRFAVENIHGDLLSLATGETLAPGGDITLTNGLGKLVIVVNAGADTAGTITVTGTSVNRDTGGETGADTDDIVLDGTSTDASDTDAESNPRYDITDAYITSKWFLGAVTISTADVNLSDVDVYHCSFEQWNDQAAFTLETLDVNAFASNASAWLYCYLYSVDVTGSKVTIGREASIELPAAKVAADRYYRLRRGAIGKELVGTNDGIFLNLFFGPTNQTYWQDVTIKVWAWVYS